VCEEKIDVQKQDREKEINLLNDINEREKSGNTVNLFQKNNNLRKNLEEMELKLKELNEKLVKAEKQILENSEIISLTEENENLKRETTQFEIKNSKRK
jgi:hypothetical protein